MLMLPRKWWHACWLILLVSVSASASLSSVYIGQTASGGDSGANCSNAHAVTFFNTAGNWGAGAAQIGAGTTVHLCGTINTGLAFQGSGSVGNTITLLFESGAALTSTAWSTSTPAIAANSQNYLTIDGNAVGVIQNTDNGSNLGHHQGTTFIDFAGSHDVEIKNFNGSGGLHNAYVNTGINNLTSESGTGSVMTYTCSGTCQVSAGATVSVQGSSISGYNVTDQVVQSASSSSFTINGATTGAGSGGSYSDEDDFGTAIRSVTSFVGVINANVHDDEIDNVLTGIYISMSTGTSSGITINNVTISETNIAIILADSNNAVTFTGGTISNSEMFDSAVWDDLDNGNHHNAIHIFASNAGSSLSGFVVNGNYFHGNPGLVAHQTASNGIFTEEVHGTSSCNGLLFYNNLQTSSVNQITSFNQLRGTSHACVYNNTIVPLTSGNSTAVRIATGVVNGLVDVQNNIFVSGSQGIYEDDANQNVVANPGHNVWYNLANGFTYHGTFGVSFATWQTDCSCDGASVTTDPKVDGTYHLLSGSSAIGLGANLSTFFTTDKAGAARPGGAAAWDDGVYIFNAAVTPAAAPATPMFAGLMKK